VYSLAFNSSVIVRVRNARQTQGRTPYDRSNSQSRSPPSKSTDDSIDHTDISYSPVGDRSELSSPPILDPTIREILNYSPPPLEERFSPPLSLNPLSPPPSHPDPAPIDWDRLSQSVYSSPTNEGDRLVTVYIPGNLLPTQSSISISFQCAPAPPSSPPTPRPLVTAILLLSSHTDAHTHDLRKIIAICLFIFT